MESVQSIGTIELIVEIRSINPLEFIESVVSLKFKESMRRREGSGLPEIKVGKGESFDSALRRFKRECQRSGVLRDLRKHQHYESPSVKRKKKSEAARARKRRRRRY